MIKKILNLALTVFIVFSFIQIYAYYRTISLSVGGEVEQVFVIKKGESAKQIGDNLEAAGLVSKSKYFYYYIRLNNLGEKIQAGEYSLNSDMNIKRIAQALTSGNALSKERDIKIIEGWRIGDIDEYLAQNGFKAGEFKLAAGNIADYKKSNPELTFLTDLPNGYSLEGFLFPDTYRIFNDAVINDIVLKMLNNFESKLTPEMRAEIIRQGKSIWEIVTMASMIEKEVRSEKDMKLVSGIFWNRIRVGQPLESCASLAYILGIDKPQYSVEDTKIDNPYNTYQNYGLPPGPIANPGIKAIEAAIYPTESDYFFFLSRSDNGETIFAKTYNEHLSNKAKYLK